MALVEGCKHELEITVPVDEVNAEVERAVSKLQKKVRLPGFRPGKAPAGIVRTKFDAEIRQEVLDELLPRFFRKAAERENLQVVGSPDVTDLHFHKGEPIRFKIQFEVAPDFDLGQYTDLTVGYDEPAVADEDVEKRLAEIREQRAEYVNVDPRPVENSDYVVVSLKSLAGVDKPVEQDEMTIQMGDPDSMPAFTENLVGTQPGDVREFDVTYPADYGKEDLAGKTVRFAATVKGIRRKELPELNDEFAQDLGDFQNLEEVKDAIRKNMLREREYEAQQEAKNALLEKLIDSHDFPVPEAYVESQIKSTLETRLRQLAAQGIDPSTLKLDWQKVKESQRDKAVRDVRGYLILDAIANRESIGATNEEVDREVHRIAKQRREPAAAVRMKLERDGSLGRIAGQIRTDKTLSFLFDKARKEAK